jgi:endonuclease YncB( thermonuclease family)
LSTIFSLPGVVPAPGFLSSEPQVIEGRFTRCGPGRGYYCVIDGDTFKMGKTSVRVVGIDTAERDAECPAEAEQAEASTRTLQGWLNRGPFEMTARLDNPTDRYGRALRTLYRIRPDGSEDRLADFMRTEGGARGYWVGWRGGWC